MLVLTRRAGEAIYLGENIKLTMVNVRGGQVRLAIDAPKEIAIKRDNVKKPKQASPRGVGIRL